MAEKYMEQPRRKQRSAKSPKPQGRSAADREGGTPNSQHEALVEWFQTVKFRKVLIGGLDERHVWRKIEELNGFYEAAIRAERARYDALLKEYQKACNAVIRKYKRELYERDKAGRRDSKDSTEESPAERYKANAH